MEVIKCLVAACLLVSVLINVDPVSCQSCREAGYTSCCNQSEDANSCEGRPLGICYCDPSCHEFDDCCDDIMEICHPEKDALISQLTPRVVYITDTSYQSTIIRWLSPLYFNNTYNTANNSLTYILQYHTSDNTSYVPYTVNVVVHQTNDSVSSNNHERYSVRLLGLMEHTVYTYSLKAVSWFGELSLDTVGSFTTLNPKSLCIEDVRLQALDSNSVQVSWSALNLLPGVTMSRHVIRYQQLPLGQEDIRMVNSSINSHVIGQLNEGMLYSFVVIATLLEEGGQEIYIGECGRTEIFLPASRLFQLTVIGYFSKHCSQWEAEEELMLMDGFRRKVVQMIRESLDSNFPTNHISNDLVLCHSTLPTLQDRHDDTSSHPFVHRLTYRANVGSTSDVTADDLIGSIQTWAHQNNEFTLEFLQDDTPETTPIATPLLTLDTDCPIHLNQRTQPLCEEDLPTPTSSTGLCISVPILVASMMALFLLLLVVVMVAIVCVLIVSQTRKCKTSVRDEALQNQNRTEATQVRHNVYMPNPTTPVTIATTAQTQPRPLAVHITESSESGESVVRGRDSETRTNNGCGVEEPSSTQPLRRSGGHSSDESKTDTHVIDSISTTV